MMLCIMAITDKNNMAPPPGVTPVAIGMLIILMGLAFSANCGGPLNPARDFSPTNIHVNGRMGSGVLFVPYRFKCGPILC